MESTRNDMYVVGYIDGDWNNVMDMVNRFQLVTGCQFSLNKRNPAKFGERGM